MTKRLNGALSKKALGFNRSRNFETSPIYSLYRLLKPGLLIPTRLYKTRHFGRFFSGKFLLSTLQILGCYLAPILHEKWDKRCIFTPIKSSVNTLNNYLVQVTPS